jgi:threonine synthase
LRRYLDLMPGGLDPGWVSLGEGGTPLLRSRAIGPALGLERLYFKNETVNPTWSFKDRYVAVSVNAARLFGRRGCVVSSTGNLGVSAAAYAAAAGMTCLFVAPRGTSEAILREARTFGARILVAAAADRLRVFDELAATGAWYPVALFLRRPVQNPFGVEGYKTFAYEMIEELGRPPAAVLFPCARGNGLYGAWKGFREAVSFGWASETPKLVACQPAVANSLEASLQRGAERAVELPRASSVAASAAETVAGDQALQAIRRSGGTALSCGEDEIVGAVHEIAREGLLVEPSSALPVACLKRFADKRLVDPSAPVVAVLTAGGVRWPAAEPKNAAPAIEIPDGGSARPYLARLEAAAR